jgi:two-component system chemotaxis response regulator CheB
VINEERLPRDVVVIGASAGGVEALIRLFAELPGDFPAAVAVVIHRSPYFAGKLGHVLGRRSALPVVEPEDGALVKPGSIYLAPRDQHVLLEAGAFRLNRGPRQHHTRPAIDPLFVSAARTYGKRVVGVILSGGGDDGVVGAIAINVVGGLVLVQDPDEARVGHMPRTAIARDHVDAVLPLAGIAAGLTSLAAGEPVEVGEVTDGRLA